MIGYCVWKGTGVAGLTCIDMPFQRRVGKNTNPRILQSYEYYLQLRDRIAGIPGHQYLEATLHYTIGMVGNAYNFVYSSLLHLVGNSVDDQQVIRLGDPNKNGTSNPTHSQLARDHDNHPFHVLVATLAKAAVFKVGEAMAARWWDGNTSAQPAVIAASYLVHPFDTNWQDNVVRIWATAHPQQIKRGESTTEWEALEKAHKKDVIDGLTKSRNSMKAAWDFINKNYE